MMAGVPAEGRDADAVFFAEHRDRSFRIREAGDGEFEAEFRSLGEHVRDRRRVIVHRMNREMRRAYGADFVPIPFLLFADETVEDRDDVLGPIFREIMLDALVRGGDRV